MKKILYLSILFFVMLLTSCTSEVELTRYDRLNQFKNEYQNKYPNESFDSLCMLKEGFYHFNIITHEIKDNKEYYITSSLIANLAEIGLMYKSTCFYYERNIIIKEFKTTTTKTEKIYFIDGDMYFYEISDDEVQISKLDKKLDYVTIYPSGLYIDWDRNYLLIQDVTEEWEELKSIAVPKNADIVNSNELYFEREGYDKNELHHIGEESYYFNDEYQLERMVVNSKKMDDNELVYEATYLISPYEHIFNFIPPVEYDKEVVAFKSYINIYDTFANLTI